LELEVRIDGLQFNGFGMLMGFQCCLRYQLCKC